LNHPELSKITELQGVKISNHNFDWYKNWLHQTSFC